MYELDAETKAAISASIAAGGPPGQQLVINRKTGALETFDGKPAPGTKPSPVYRVGVSMDTGKVTGETLAPVKRENDGKPPRKRDREGYMRYKNSRPKDS